MSDNSKLGKLGSLLGKQQKDDDGEEAYEEEMPSDSANRLADTFHQQALAEQQNMIDIGDSEFWCCVIFQSRKQKEAWLEALGLLELGDKYLDGLQVSAAMKIKLPKGPDWKPLKATPGKKFGDLVKGKGEEG